MAITMPAALTAAPQKEAPSLAALVARNGFNTPQAIDQTHTPRNPIALRLLPRSILGRV